MTTSKKEKKNKEDIHIIINILKKDAGFTILALILLLIPIVLLYLPWVNKYFTILVLIYILIWSYLLKRHWKKIAKEINTENENKKTD